MQLMKNQLPYIAIIVVILQVCLAVEQQKSNTAIQRQGKSSATNSHHVPPKGDTFIDDDELDGSGHHGGEIHEDLEKEIENSGSGFGPDDEDLAISPRVNKPQYTPPKYSTDHTEHNHHHNNNNNNNNNNKKVGESSTPHFDEEGSGDGAHFDEDDEDEDDGGDGDGDGIDEKNNAPTLGTGDDFTTEVKQTEVDPSTIKEDDDTKEDDEDDDEEEDEEDELEIDQDGEERRIYEATDVNNNAELPKLHGPHNVDVDHDQTTNKEITTDKSDANDNTDDNDTKKNEGDRKDVIATNNDVSISGARDETISGTASFFAQPGILAAVIGGAVVGLLCAILVVMFIVYRMRKKDEGSYALEEPKRAPVSYAKGANNHEFFA